MAKAKSSVHTSVITKICKINAIVVATKYNLLLTPDSGCCKRETEINYYNGNIEKIKITYRTYYSDYLFIDQNGNLNRIAYPIGADGRDTICLRI